MHKREERVHKGRYELKLQSKIPGTSSMTKRIKSRNLKWMRESSLGPKQQQSVEQNYHLAYPKLSSSYHSSTLTQKLPKDLS
jgi:hypothetical protein